MEPTSIPEEILNLPLSINELSTKSRKLRGCHLFVSRWHRKFKALTALKQREIYELSSTGSSDISQLQQSLPSRTESQSFDSTDSRINGPLCPYRRMKLCWVYWKDEELVCKEAWNERARLLNLRPVPGVVTEVPNAWSPSEFTSEVFHSLAVEWGQIVGLFRRTIKYKKASMEEKMKVYMFGKEKVKILSQSFRFFRLSHIMTLTLFGDRFSKIESDHMIQETKKSVVLHLDTMKAIRNIFIISNESAVFFQSVINESTISQSCCGKVRLDYGGKSTCGYLIDETDDKKRWIVHLLNDEIIEMDKLKYDPEMCTYLYDDMVSNNGYKISFYSPIRIVIAKGQSQSKILFNKVGFNHNNQLILNYSSYMPHVYSLICIFTVIKYIP